MQSMKNSLRISAILLLLALILFCAAPALASAQRVALVIGNGAYRHAVSLPNPPNDARAVSAALERLGFAVTRLEDAGKGDLENRLAQFRGQSRGADLAVLYYAGHAVQIENPNTFNRQVLDFLGRHDLTER